MTGDIVGVEEVEVVNVVAGVVRVCICERVKDGMIEWTVVVVDAVVVGRLLDGGGALTGGEGTGVKLAAAGLRLDMTEVELVTAVTAVTAETDVTGTVADKAGGVEVDTGLGVGSLRSSLVIAGCDPIGIEDWSGSLSSPTSP